MMDEVSTKFREIEPFQQHVVRKLVFSFVRKNQSELKENRITTYQIINKMIIQFLYKTC